MENVYLETSSFSSLYGRIERILSTAKTISHSIERAVKKIKDTAETLKLIIDFGVKLLWIFIDWLNEIHKLLPLIISVIIYDAYQKEDKESINLFFSDFLELQPSSNKEINGDRLEALYMILDSPDWLLNKSISTLGMIKYLNYTIIRRANGIYQDRNKRDKINKRFNVNHFEEYNIIQNKDLRDPLKVLIEKEVSSGLSDFIERIIKQLNPLDKQIFYLLLKGYSKAECAREVGCEGHYIQSFHRKMLRKKYYFV
jgi:hypothetical protein